MKFHYSPRGANGIVLAETSVRKKAYDYSVMPGEVSEPLELRNYSSGISIWPDKGFNLDDYVNAWLSQHAPTGLSGVSSTVDVACLISPDKHIKPLLVLNVEGWDTMPKKTVDTLAATAMEIANSLPPSLATDETFLKKSWSHAVLKLKIVGQ